jgi:hypothetical protein
MGLPGLRHPMFPKPGGKLFVIYFCQNDWKILFRKVTF